jgi:hypothetical protein
MGGGGNTRPHFSENWLEKKNKMNNYYCANTLTAKNKDKNK